MARPFSPSTARPKSASTLRLRPSCEIAVRLSANLCPRIVSAETWRDAILGPQRTARPKCLALRVRQIPGLRSGATLGALLNQRGESAAIIERDAEEGDDGYSRPFAARRPRSQRARDARCLYCGQPIDGGLHRRSEQRSASWKPPPPWRLPQR